MESLETSYRIEIKDLLQITCYKEEDPGDEQEFQPSGDGGTLPTTDPDFEQVSAFLLRNEPPDPEEANAPSLQSPTPTPEASPVVTVTPSALTGTGETEVYTSDITDRLDNLIIQVGVIDIVLVLTLLISIIKNFIKVPR